MRATISAFVTLSIKAIIAKQSYLITLRSQPSPSSLQQLWNYSFLLSSKNLVDPWIITTMPFWISLQTAKNESGNQTGSDNRGNGVADNYDRHHYHRGTNMMQQKGQPRHNGIGDDRNRHNHHHNDTDHNRYDAAQYHHDSDYYHRDRYLAQEKRQHQPQPPPQQHERTQVISNKEEDEYETRYENENEGWRGTMANFILAGEEDSSDDESSDHDDTYVVDNTTSKATSGATDRGSFDADEPELDELSTETPPEFESLVDTLKTKMTNFDQNVDDLELEQLRQEHMDRMKQLRELRESDESPMEISTKSRRFWGGLKRKNDSSHQAKESTTSSKDKEIPNEEASESSHDKEMPKEEVDDNDENGKNDGGDETGLGHFFDPFVATLTSLYEFNEATLRRFTEEFQKFNEGPLSQFHEEFNKCAFGYLERKEEQTMERSIAEANEDIGDEIRENVDAGSLISLKSTDEASTVTSKGSNSKSHSMKSEETEVKGKKGKHPESITVRPKKKKSKKISKKKSSPRSSQKTPGGSESRSPMARVSGERVKELIKLFERQNKETKNKLASKHRLSRKKRDHQPQDRSTNQKSLDSIPKIDRTVFNKMKAVLEKTLNPTKQKEEKEEHHENKYDSISKENDREIPAHDEQAGFGPSDASMSPSLLENISVLTHRSLNTDFSFATAEPEDSQLDSSDNRIHESKNLLDRDETTSQIDQERIESSPVEDTSSRNGSRTSAVEVHMKAIKRILKNGTDSNHSRGSKAEDQLESRNDNEEDNGAREGDKKSKRKKSKDSKGKPKTKEGPPASMSTESSSKKSRAKASKAKTEIPQKDQGDDSSGSHKDSKKGTKKGFFRMIRRRISVHKKAKRNGRSGAAE